MKSLGTLRNIAAMLDDNVVTVACTFPNSEKRYNYLCKKDLAQELEFGNPVVVSARNGYSIAYVQEVHDFCDIDPESGITYLWLLSKVNGSARSTLEQWQTDIANELMRRQRHNAQKAVLKELGIDPTQARMLGEEKRQNNNWEAKSVFKENKE